jgi:hypothetical protein
MLSKVIPEQFPIRETIYTNVVPAFQGELGEDSDNDEDFGLEVVTDYEVLNEFILY